MHIVLNQKTINFWFLFSKCFTAGHTDTTYKNQQPSAEQLQNLTCHWKDGDQAVRDGKIQEKGCCSLVPCDYDDGDNHDDDEEEGEEFHLVFFN